MINQRKDIIDWKVACTMDFEAFKHIQGLLEKLNMHLSEHNTRYDPATDKKEECPHCHDDNRIDLNYGISKRSDQLTYTICLNCWQVTHWVPIYED